MKKVRTMIVSFKIYYTTKTTTLRILPLRSITMKGDFKIVTFLRLGILRLDRFSC